MPYFMSFNNVPYKMLHMCTTVVKRATNIQFNIQYVISYFKAEHHKGISVYVSQLILLATFSPNLRES